jgi:hypothetical protein
MIYRVTHNIGTKEIRVADFVRRWQAEQYIALLDDKSYRVRRIVPFLERNRIIPEGWARCPSCHGVVEEDEILNNSVGICNQCLDEPETDAAKEI